jgi:hypothetical protein
LTKRLLSSTSSLLPSVHVNALTLFKLQVTESRRSTSYEPLEATGVMLFVQRGKSTLHHLNALDPGGAIWFSGVLSLALPAGLAPASFAFEARRSIY